MRTRLERLLQNIEPIPDRIDRFADKALNTFPVTAAIITEWETYRRCLAEFFCHMECIILGIGSRSADVDFYIDRCWRLLRKKYGDSAPQACFESIRTGSEGGLRRVLITASELFSKDYAENLIGLTVEAYWSNRDPSAILADADEYVRLYRHILPGEITEGSATRIRFNFRKVLKQHPFFIRRLRRAQTRPRR